MLSYLSRVKSAFFILLAHDTLTAFSFSFIFLFFQQQGYSPWWMILGYVLYSALGIMLTYAVKVFYLRLFLIISFVGYSLLSFVLYLNPWQGPLLYGAILSLPLIFFWIPLNYLFFKTSTKENHALNSSLFMVVPGIISIIMPPLGAWVIHNYGYSWLFIITSLMFLLPILIVAFKIPEEKITTSTTIGTLNYKGLRTITFCEGALHFFTGVIIPIYALFFFTQVKEVGWFYSYLGALGLIISILVSYHSDKTQQRKKHLFLLFFLLTIITIILAFIHTVSGWLIAIGIFTIIYTISSPLRLAISMDTKKMDLEFWKMREIFLNAGRFVTLSLSAIFFYYELYWTVFVMFGIITAVYPFLIYHKLKEIG